MPDRRVMRVWRPGVAAVAGTLLLGSPPRAQELEHQDTVRPPLNVRLTSPMGRTGVSGTIRVVAQVIAPPEVALQPVRFYVNGVLLGEDAEGPPYAVPWVDENPFDATEITVEVADALGRRARDAVTLPPFEIYETTEVRSVLLEASVQDKAGRYVQGLQREDFSLAEDGTPQQMDMVRPDVLPGAYALLVDNSQSMARRAEFLREAGRRFCEVLKPGDRVLVVPFSKQLGAITGPTDDRPTILEAVEDIDPRGGTAILDALVAVAPLFSAQPGRRAVVLMTDGYDEHSVSSFDDALAAVQREGITVYVVGIGGIAGISIKGERLLQQLARETGGRWFFPSRETDVPAVHARVAADVQSRYFITYTPTNQRSDGTWRGIELTTVDPSLAVRVRPGYFAPKPPPVRPSLEFTVTDPQDRYLEVSREQLRVVEDGVPQDVDTFQEAVNPVAIVLELDASGSMKAAVEAVKEAAKSFVEAVRPEDSLAVLQFSDHPTFAHDLTKDRARALSAIDQYAVSGGTALYDSIVEAAMRLEREDARRVIVVLTDGRDENNPGTAPGSEHTLGEVLERVRSSGTTVFTIGLGPKVDRAPLEQLAHESGGRAYFPEDVLALREPYLRILEDLRRRYIVSYTSTNSARDGAWRAVEIALDGSEARVASRGGYFAPAR